MNLLRTNLHQIFKDWQFHLKIFLMASGLGLAWFLIMFGYTSLVFSNVNWIYNAGGDVLQHYLGWLFYRNDSWVFPIGQIQSFGFPFGINLIYTDSLPLITIPLKIVSSFIHPRFQFFGWYVLFGLIAQAFFSILIFRLFNRNPFYLLLAGSMLILSPIFIMRAWGHTSLSSHWMILAALYLTLLRRIKPVSIGWWGSLFCISILIHPYFLPMIAVFFLVFLLESLTKARDALILVGKTVLIAAGVVLVGWVTGIFGPSTSPLSAWGYGYYSLNFNALINPITSTSFFFQPRPLVLGFQWEGYNYLGAGYMFTGLVGLFFFIQRRDLKQWFLRNKYLWLAVVFLTIFAASNRITFDDQLLFEINLPQEWVEGLGIFRSSGRLFWPVFYLFIITAITVVARAKKTAIFILIIGIFVQFIDVQPLIKTQQAFAFAKYQSPLKSTFWNQAKTSFHHIMLLPADRLISLYEPFAIYAAENRMSINWGYFARADYAAILNYGTEEIEKLASGNGENDTIYTFCNVADVDHIMTQNQSGNTTFINADHYFVGFSNLNPIQNKISSDEFISQEKIKAFSLGNYLHSDGKNKIFIMSGKGEYWKGTEDLTSQILSSSGLHVSNQQPGGYLAIFGNGIGDQSVEIFGKDAAEVTYSQRSNVGSISLPFNLKFSSIINSTSNFSSIQINQAEYSINKNGLNIVSYDIETGAIESKNFYQFFPTLCN